MDSSFRPTRRNCLAAGAGVSASLVLGSQLALALQGEQGRLPSDPNEALRLLKEGNRRFAEGRVLHVHEAASWREHLKQGQQPFATILGCSDSRVQPELVFDHGFGD